MRNKNEYIAVELQPKNVILAGFRRFNGHKAVGCIHSPASRFIYSARASITAIYIRCISVSFVLVEAPNGVQRPADHPGAVGAVVRFERAAGEITFVRSYFN